MGLRDKALEYLNDIFGKEREEREKALSPSIEAEKNIPNNVHSIPGRDDLGGLLSVSPDLMMRYADYEAMEDYPDIACFATGTLVYICDGSMTKAVPIESLAISSESYEILSYDRKRDRTVRVRAFKPRLTGRNVPVVKLKLSNGRSLRVTPTHKILANGEYIDAKDLKVGDSLVSSPTLSLAGMGFVSDYRTNEIIVIEAAVNDGLSDVYDITTETHNFFAEGVVCHNSSWRYFANDATQPDMDSGKTIWVSSKHEAIKQMGDTLIQKRLRLEDDIWSMTYNLVKMGNEMNEMLVTENGVVGLNYLPCPTVRRIEKSDGSLIGFVQDITGRFNEDSKALRNYLGNQGNIPEHVAVFPEWQVCHMRLNHTKRKSPYGFSLADSSRAIWKRIILLEDSMMLYRLQRSPARYAYYVDVGDHPPDKVEGILRRAKQELKKKSVVNPRTQRMDMRFNPVSSDEDIILGMRDGKPLGRVELLAGPVWPALDDIEYFKRMLHGNLNVPRSYLGQDGPVQSRSILSNEDSRAARVTLGIQRELRNGIKRIMEVDLAARGINPFKYDFDIKMTLPSGIFELAQMELKSARADYAAKILPFTSMNYIRSVVLHMSDDVIAQIEKQSQKDKEQSLADMTSQQKAMMQLQLQASQQQQLANPEAIQGQPNQQGQVMPPEMPNPMMPLPSELPRTAIERKIYDNAKRIEEIRERETQSRLSELEDAFHKAMKQDRDFKRKVMSSRAFFDDIKEAITLENGNQVMQVPVAKRLNGPTNK